MKESRFIEENKSKWIEFEKCIKEKDENPEKLSRLFIQITDDLAFSRTYYPNRSVRAYLNGLARHVFIGIYKNKKNSTGNFLKFWSLELPLIMHQCRKQLLLSLIIFIFSMGIGIFSSIHDTDFARHILGDKYVEMTVENIKNKDPMAVYKKMNHVDMFFGITLNNLRVAFYTFVTGLFFAIGSVGVLLYNGIMVGTFQYFFIERGLFRESFLTIWQHGTLEISAIIIAGAAGIVMGNGLLFPGTYSRFYALRLSAKKGLKIMLGISPIIIMAGFIEGFFTRHTEAPTFMRIMVIVLSFIFILYYFVIYPYIISGKQEKTDDGVVIEAPVESIPFQKSSVYSVAQIISFTFQQVFTTIKKVVVLTGALALMYTVFIYVYFNVINPNGYMVADVNGFSNKFIYMGYENNPALFFFNILFLTLAVILFIRFITVQEKFTFKKSAKHFINILIPVSVINAVFYIHKIWGVIISMAILPVFIMYIVDFSREHLTIFESVRNMMKLLKGLYGRVYGVYLRILAISVFFILLMNTRIFNSMLQTIQWGFYFQPDDIDVIIDMVSIFIRSCMYLFCLFTLVMASGIHLYSIQEIKTGRFLRQRMNDMGISKKE